ncbi:hypothetical protein [Abyssibacter sp.]|uniref:hypothetical protein n=1 Tax=Abyssibacter sp. TaxID=2320200 RepID=UPI0035186141
MGPNHKGNGSERSDTARAGMSDAELDRCVQALGQDLGRVPKLAEIIDAAGGCKRQRAVDARRRFATDLVANAIDDWTDLPPSIVMRHKRLMREWLALARDQITPWVDDVVAQSLETSTGLEARIAEQTVLIEQQASEIDALREERAALARRLDEACAQLAEARRDSAVWQALAEERRQASTAEPTD